MDCQPSQPASSITETSLNDFRSYEIHHGGPACASRMCNKLRIQEQMKIMVKLTVGINNSTDDRVELMKVLPMMMRVANMEEINVLQETMNNMVLEKRKQEKGL